MSRARKMIEKVCRELSAQLIQAYWVPLSLGGMKCGPEGGWTVCVRFPQDEGDTICIGTNAQAVCEDIAFWKRWKEQK